MEWLLKIVEGPMNGAEIALVAGLRVRVGSGTDCDIVLADATLPETAFELDVSAESVSLVRGEDVRTLVPFEIFEVGTSGFVIGPASGPWKPLRKVEKKAEAEGESKGEAKVEPKAEAKGQAETAGETPRPPEESVAPKKSHKGLRWLIVLLLLCGFAFAGWYFWPQIVERFPAAEETRILCCERVKSWYDEAKASIGGEGKTATADKARDVLPKTTLADIAREHNLELATSRLSESAKELPVLRGNLARRTERMAIRSLAQSVDPRVKLELTDDETLFAAASELLFVVTEGAIKAASASNGVVTVVGHSPSRASLERTIRALNADVKGIGRVVTTGVTVGGPPPAVTVAGAPEAKAVFAEAQPAKKAPRSRGTKTNPARDYPIAGILTKPYPAVVLNNGMRLIEGAQIADVVIERINADGLVLRSGSTTFEWKP